MQARRVSVCPPDYSSPAPPLSRRAHLSHQPSQAPFLWKLRRAAWNNLSWLFPGRSLCRPTLPLPFPTPECFFQGHLQPCQLFQNLSRSSVSHEAGRMQLRVLLSWSQVVFSSRRCDAGHWDLGSGWRGSPLLFTFCSHPDLLTLVGSSRLCALVGRS